MSILNELISKAGASCGWTNYVNFPSEIVNIFKINDSFKLEEIIFEKGNIDDIALKISLNNLNLVLFEQKIIIKKNNSDYIQFHRQGLIVDSMYNILDRIKTNEFEICKLGYIYKSTLPNNFILKLGVYNSPLYYRYSEDGIISPSLEVLHKYYESLINDFSTFLNNLYSEVFFPWHFIKYNFAFYGKFCSNENRIHRSILEIIDVNKKFHILDYDSKLDAIVIMMNPGGSEPLEKNSNEYVKTKPDLTQYQICHLMAEKKWKKVIVLNLLDYCEADSNIVFELFRDQIPDCSIFSDLRINELESVFSIINKKTPVILAWGVNDSLKKIKDKAIEFLTKNQYNVIGWKNNKNDYYHPFPRGKQNLELKKNWVSNIIKYL